jgi:hypothetical protein
MFKNDGRVNSPHSEMMYDVLIVGLGRIKLVVTFFTLSTPVSVLTKF